MKVLIGFLGRVGSGVISGFLRADDFVRPLTLYITHSPIVQLLAAFAALLGFGVVLVTAYQIGVDLEDRKSERAQRVDDAIERAWDRLLRPAAGNTGKGEAMTYLLERGISLNGVDLSCRSIGNWDRERNECARRVQIEGVRIDKTDWEEMAFGTLPKRGGVVSNGILASADLSDTDLFSFHVTLMQIRNINLSRTNMVGSILLGTVIRGWFDEAYIGNCDLSDARIYPTEKPPTLHRCAVNNALLPWLDEETSWTELTAWADTPPLDIDPPSEEEGEVSHIRAHGPMVLGRIRLCEPPLDEGGKPVSARPVLMFILSECKPVSVEDAMKRYPEAYKPLQPPSMFEIGAYHKQHKKDLSVSPPSKPEISSP